MLVGIARRMPAKMYGRVQGSRIFLNSSQRLAPNTRADRIRLPSTSRAPAAVLRAIGKKVPRKTRKMIGRSPNPNQTAVIGRRAISGVAQRDHTIGAPSR